MPKPICPNIFSPVRALVITPAPKPSMADLMFIRFTQLQLFRVGLGGSRNVLPGELAGLVAAGGVGGGIAGGPNWSDVAREYLLFSCLTQRTIGYPIVLGWFAGGWATCS